MKILAIYDKPATVDRFTVIVDAPRRPQDVYYDALGCDDNGGQSFSQWAQAQYTPGGRNIHLGKRIDFCNLNEATQRHIAKRVLMED